MRSIRASAGLVAAAITVGMPSLVRGDVPGSGLVVSLGPAMHLDTFLGRPSLLADAGISFGHVEVGGAVLVHGGIGRRGALLHAGYRWSGALGSDPDARGFYALWAGPAISTLCLGFGDLCGGFGVAAGGELGVRVPIGQSGEFGLALRSTSVLAFPIGVPFVTGVSASYGW